MEKLCRNKREISNEDGVAEAELGIHGVVVDVDADAGIVEVEVDSEVVGDLSNRGGVGVGDGEVEESGRVNGGTDVVGWGRMGTIPQPICTVSKMVAISRYSDRSSVAITL